MFLKPRVKSPKSSQHQDTAEHGLMSLLDMPFQTPTVSIRPLDSASKHGAEYARRPSEYQRQAWGIGTSAQRRLPGPSSCISRQTSEELKAPLSTWLCTLQRFPFVHSS